MKFLINIQDFLYNYRKQVQLFLLGISLIYCSLIVKTYYQYSNSFTNQEKELFTYLADYAASATILVEKAESLDSLSEKSGDVYKKITAFKKNVNFSNFDEAKIAFLSSKKVLISTVPTIEKANDKIQNITPPNELKAFHNHLCDISKSITRISQASLGCIENLEEGNYWNSSTKLLGLYENYNYLISIFKPKNNKKRLTKSEFLFLNAFTKINDKAENLNNKMKKYSSFLLPTFLEDKLLSLAIANQMGKNQDLSAINELLNNEISAQFVKLGKPHQFLSE